MYYAEVELVAECIGCHNTSLIRPTQPTIEIEFGPGSEGRLCKMTPTLEEGR